jgi:LysM repeat protein
MSNVSRVASAAATFNDAPAPTGRSYEVQRGDSLQRIASDHGVKLDALLAANPQVRNPDVIYPGTRLQLPDAAASRYTVRPGDSLNGIAAEHGLSLKTLLAANPQLRNPDLIHVGESIHLPEALSDGVAKLLPEPTHGLLHAVPLLALYRLDPTWRQDTYNAAVRLGSIVMNSGQALFAHMAPEGSLQRDVRRDVVAERSVATPQRAAPEVAFDARNARDRRWLQQRDGLIEAAGRADVDAGIVAMIANFESGFNADARPVARDASRNTVRQFDGTMALSTAHGLGQFTDGTWRQMLRTHGADYGVANAATLTTAQANAHRNDAALQAGMLAEFTRENVETGRRLGGADDVANVYALHNLGGGDGRSFLRALANDPDTRVDDVLSRAVIRNNASLYGDGSITVEAAYGRMGDAMRAGQRFADDARQRHDAR